MKNTLLLLLLLPLACAASTCCQSIAIETFSYSLLSADGTTIIPVDITYDEPDYWCLEPAPEPTPAYTLMPEPAPYIPPMTYTPPPGIGLGGLGAEPPVSNTPEPVTKWLIGWGLVTLGLLKWRERRLA